MNDQEILKQYFTYSEVHGKYEALKKTALKVGMDEEKVKAIINKHYPGNINENEKKNSAFDEAKAYIEKALKEGGHVYNSVLATIIDYGLTKSEAAEMMNIYGKVLKNAGDVDQEVKDLEEDIAAAIEGKKSAPTVEAAAEIDRDIKKLKDRLEGLKSRGNKNMIDMKIGDIADIETTGMASVGQKKQYNDGEGNNWWIEVTKVTKKGYTGKVVGKVGGTVNTDEERRNIGKDLYGSELKNYTVIIAHSNLSAGIEQKLKSMGLSEGAIGGGETEFEGDSNKAEVEGYLKKAGIPYDLV